MTGYRDLLYETFLIQYPEWQTTPQRLSDQVRAIKRLNLIPEPRRILIAQQVTNEITQDTARMTDDNNNDERAEETLQHTSHTQTQQEIGNTQESDHASVHNQHQQPTRTSLMRLSNTLNSPVSHNRNQSIEDTFQRFYALYDGVEPERRPPIPKIKTSKKATLTIQYVDEHVVAVMLDQDTDLDRVHTIVYCAALTVADALGILRLEPEENPRKHRTDKDSGNKTMIRINKKIENLRAQIGQLTSYIQGSKSRRMKNKVNKILKNNNQHSRFENNNHNFDLTLDTLKQKLSVLVTRRQKYRKSIQRKQDNNKFKTNEKAFYRKLKQNKNGNQDNSEKQILDKEEITEFWRNIWSQQKQHNFETTWLEREHQRNASVTEMEHTPFTKEDVQKIIAKTHNWKAPGPDKVQNFWFKRFCSTHSTIARIFNNIIDNPEQLPAFCTKRKTIMIPKDGRSGDPSKFRPITCLPTIYKILTACINDAVYKHCETNKIINEEQKGCTRGSRGCKEQLIVDKVILEQATKNNRNLHVAYIDYQKAFDSLPHSWLMQVLEIYKVNPKIVTFLKHAMQNWKTQLIITNNDTTIVTDEIEINCGIYQGDSFSALWFCMAINPLSNVLKATKYGFSIKTPDRNDHIISHLLYMDDLKIYASTKNQLEQMLHLIQVFTDDIKMCLGLDKCRKLHITRGKIMQQDSEEEIMPEIETMSGDELYKYLGMKQNNKVREKIVKGEIKKEFKKRLNLICKTELTGKNQIKAINTFVISILTYSFGILKWTRTELEELQRAIRTTLTKHGYHHPKCCIERMTLPRTMAGRGLIDITNLHDRQIISMRRYFHEKQGTSELHRAVAEADEDITPLCLFAENAPVNPVTVQDKKDKWAEKPVHGRFYHSLYNNAVDINWSNQWLKEGYIFAETEGFFFAIQDEVIPTRNYNKYIVKNPDVVTDTCRRCGERGETIEHIVSACSALAQTEYLRRHNNVVKILYQQLCKINKIKIDDLPYYKFQPQAVVSNQDIKIYYDRTILTNHTREHNRPDITLINTKERIAQLIDVTIPLNRNMQKSYTEKINKYAELAIEIKRQHKLKSTTVIPIVLSSTGLIHKNLKTHLQQIGINTSAISKMQRAVIIDTCSTVRKFMQ